jgi:hypothetical protein
MSLEPQKNGTRSTATYIKRANGTSDISEFIEIWYNRKRRHSASRLQTIEEF